MTLRTCPPCFWLRGLDFLERTCFGWRNHRRAVEGLQRIPHFEDGETCADETDLTSNMFGATSDSEEVAAFSPEGLIDWMFERCNRRFEYALLAGHNEKAQAYNQRLALLAEFRNFVGAAGEQATDMLNTMEDLSSCEGSPTRDL